nr:short-chain type dehydrogenase/reductase [Tanacetum cinerariifolium]
LFPPIPEETNKSSSKSTNIYIPLQKIDHNSISGNVCGYQANLPKLNIWAEVLASLIAWKIRTLESDNDLSISWVEDNGIDPTFLEALPVDLRAEVIASLIAWKIRTPESDNDLSISWDSLKTFQSGFGTAAVCGASARIFNFYEHESCGQYTPFREGTGAVWMITERMKCDRVTGQAGWARLPGAAGKTTLDQQFAVNDAGIMDPTYPLIMNSSLEEFDRIFAVNTRGAYLCCKEAAKRLKQGGGRIICLTKSLVGALKPGYGLYTASKVAVEAMVKILAKELKGTNITAICVAPGP